MNRYTLIAENAKGGTLRHYDLTELKPNQNEYEVSKLLMRKCAHLNPAAFSLKKFEPMGLDRYVEIFRWDGDGQLIPPRDPRAPCYQ